MKKIGFLLACMLLGAPLALAQYTVTATVTDHPDGQTWNSGRYRIDFYPTAAAPQLPAGTQASYIGTLSSSGGLSQVLPQVTQNGASWKFTICPMASLVGACPSVVLPIQASGSVSTALSAIALSPRFPAGPASYGYTDAECIPPSLPGPGYFNVGSNSYQLWNGIAWQSSGAGYLGLGGGTLTGNLTISNSAAAPQNLLTVGGASGLWANLVVNEQGNLLVLESGNQYIGTTPFLVVAPNIFTGSNLGPFINVWGLDVSCAGGIPNTGCTGGFFQSSSAGNLLMSGNSQGTSPVALTMYGASSLTTGTVNSGGLGQTAASSMGGTCAMAAATSCAITLGHTYTTPVCIVTQQSATLTGGAVGCTVSGGTATVTAATSNSETWGVLVFGNPS